MFANSVLEVLYPPCQFKWMKILRSVVPRIVGLGLPVMCCLAVSGALAEELKPGVRGVVTRAPDSMTIDGDLAEFKDAFCTPIEYHNSDPNSPAAEH